MYLLMVRRLPSCWSHSVTRATGWTCRAYPNDPKGIIMSDHALVMKHDADQ